MAEIAYDPTIPAFPGYKKPEPVPPGPSFLDTIGAAFGRENDVAALIHMAGREEFAPDDAFDFDAYARKSPLYTIYPQAFNSARSQLEFDAIERRVQEEAARDQILAASGATGLIASIAAGALSPTMLLPGGQIYRGVKGLNLLKSAVSVGAAAGAGVAVQESILQKDQELRTKQESAVNVLGGIVLGGLLGGGFSALARKELEPIARRMVDAPGDTTIHPLDGPSALPQVDDEAGSLGAARVGEVDKLNLGAPEGVRSALGLEKALNWVNPQIRTATSEFALVRAASGSLDTGGIMLQGTANIGGDVETLAKQTMFRLYDVIRKRDEILGGNFASRFRGTHDFDEQTMMALRRGGQHEDPKVVEYAAYVKENFFDQFYKDAKAAGFKNFQDLPEDFIANYAPRMPRKALIAKDYDEFLGILEEHLTEQLKQRWDNRLATVNRRNEVEGEQARILELDEAGAKAERDATEQKIAALPDEFEAATRERAEEIRALRAEAKVEKDRAKAKALRAEAQELEEANKELLRPFRLAENKLKNKFRLLAHSVAGIKGKNRALMARIEKLMEDADATRARFVRVAQKQLAQLEDLKPEAREKVIDDLLEKLDRVEASAERAWSKLDDAGEEGLKEITDAQAENLVRQTFSLNEQRAMLEEARNLPVEMQADRIMNVVEEMTYKMEQINTRRALMVERLSSKFENPNVAKAEAAALREKGQKRFWALARKASDENVKFLDAHGQSIDPYATGASGVDITRAAKDLADEIGDAYLGGHTVPFFKILEERGSEHTRLLNIDETRTWSNGRRFEEFMENNLELVLRRYARTLAPDIELMKKFGTVNPLNPTSQFMKRLKAEKAEKIDEARATLSGKKLDKRLQEITHNYDRGIKDLEVMVSRVRNIRGMPEDANGWTHRLGQGARNLNLTRMMGKVVLSSIPDAGAIVLKHGMTRMFGTGLKRLFLDLDSTKLLSEEIKMAGVATDLVLHSRLNALYETFDQLRAGSMVERGLQFMANNLGVVTGMDRWNAGMKQFAGTLTIMKMSKALEALAGGRANKSAINYLARMGIDERLAKNIWLELSDNGTRVKGILLPNTELWGRGAGVSAQRQANAIEAKRVFRGAIAREVDDTIVTPGTERPAWMDGSEMGRLVGQFRSFTFASSQKVLMSMAQELRHGDAAMRVQVLAGISSMVALGAIAHYTWAYATSQRAVDQMKAMSFDQRLEEAVLRSGLLGLLGETPRVSEDVFGKQLTLQDTKSSKTNYDTNIYDILGPTAGLLANLSKAAVGALDDKKGFSRGETSAIRQLLPYNNLFYLNFVFTGSPVTSAFEGAAR